MPASKVEPGLSSPSLPLDEERCPLKFIESKKGKKLLVLDGYIFHLNTKNKTTGYFKCSQTYKGCGARIVLKNWNQNNYSFEGYEITNGRHVNHLPDFGKIRKKKTQVQSEKVQDLNAPEFRNSKHVCLFCLSSLPPDYHLKPAILTNVVPSGKELAVILDNPTKNSQAFDLLCSLLNLKWRRYQEGRTFDQTISLPLCLNCQHLYQEVFQLHIQIRELEILINKRIKVIRDVVQRSGENEGTEESGQTQLAFLGLDSFRRKVRDASFNKFGCDADEDGTPITSTNTTHLPRPPSKVNSPTSTATKIKPEVDEVPENIPFPDSPSSFSPEQPIIVKQEVNPEDEHFEDNYYETTPMTYDGDPEENDGNEDCPSSPRKEDVPSSMTQRMRSTRQAAQRASERVTLAAEKYTSSDEDGDSDANLNEDDNFDDTDSDLDSDTQFTTAPKNPKKRSPYRIRLSSTSLSRPMRYLRQSGAVSSSKSTIKSTRQYKCNICSTILIGFKLFDQHIKKEHPGRASRYSCKFCNRNFSSLYKVTIHQHTHTGEKPFKCPHCSFTTSHPSTLPAHISKKHSSKPKDPSIPCPQCPKKFFTHSVLNNHLIASHGLDDGLPKFHKKSGKPIPTLTCHLCPAKLMGQGPFLQHYSDIHPAEKRFTCKFCQLHFRFIRDVLDHQRRHTGERPFKCDKCDKSFVATKNLQSHTKYHHPDHLETFSCSKCPKIFPSRSALSSHMYIHIDALSFCKTCGRSFRFKCQFALHNQKVHNGTAELSPPVKELENLEGNLQKLGIKPKVRCHICWKPVIGGKKFIQKHFDDCHPNHQGGLYTCQCGKKFINYWRTVDHAKRHHRKDKEFQCDQCPHKSYSLADLTRHKESHVPVEERRGNHICDVCGMGLASGMTLWQHRKIHDDGDLKRWVCDECGKSYREKRGLDEHTKTQHLKILPWKCDKCEKAFGRRSILRRHQRIHLGYKPYKCELCEVAFVHPTSRTRHMREVHKEGGEGGKGRERKTEKRRKMGGGGLKTEKD